MKGLEQQDRFSALQWEVIDNEGIMKVCTVCTFTLGGVMLRASNRCGCVYGSSITCTCNREGQYSTVSTVIFVIDRVQYSLTGDECSRISTVFIRISLNTHNSSNKDTRLFYKQNQNLRFMIHLS
jgi:hypothetical protein